MPGKAFALIAYQDALELMIDGSSALMEVSAATAVGTKRPRKPTSPPRKAPTPRGVPKGVRARSAAIDGGGGASDAADGGGGDEFAAADDRTGEDQAGAEIGERPPECLWGVLHE